MQKLYRLMETLIQKEESFAVATIFDKTGSAPRTAGAKMVVRADGSTAGTIGGGRLEAGYKSCLEDCASRNHAAVL